MHLYTHPQAYINGHFKQECCTLCRSAGHASTKDALNLKTSKNVGVLAAAVAEESAHAHRTTQVQDVFACSPFLNLACETKANLLRPLKSALVRVCVVNGFDITVTILSGAWGSLREPAIPARRRVWVTGPFAAV